MARFLLLIQAAYYGITGLWPLIHMPSFERVTGPKHDDWLVQTVGALTLAIAAAFLAGAARTGKPARETLVLAGASALAFGAVDVVFHARGILGSVYLADAAVQAVFVAAAAAGLRSKR
jgi:hypothetical protein